jgi:UDP-N-acetylglucosamine/UDP-N-acetylgalactosamine diphosphorylase
MIEVPKQGVNMPFVPGMYRSVKRVMINNIIYIANLVALMQWYDHVRSQFISDDFSEPLFNGLTEKLDMIIDERIARLCAFSQKMPGSAKAYKENVKEHASALVLDQKNELYNQWSEIDAFFSERRRLKAGDADRDIFLENIHHAIKGFGKDYIRAIKSLSLEDTHPGTRWLQGIVDTVTKKVLKLLPSFSI